MSLITYEASFVYSPNGVTPLYNPFAYITELEIDSPEAVIVDMTDQANGQGVRALVPTGEKVGGSIRIAFWLQDSTWVPGYWTGTWGLLEFSATSYSYTNVVLCKKASLEFRTASAVRGTAEFVETSYPYVL